MRAAATAARLKDYKLFEEAEGNTIYFRHSVDAGRFHVAMKPNENITAKFVQTEKNYDIGKLKRHLADLQKITDMEGFGNSILFELDRRDRCIYFEAATKKAYFDFSDFVEENLEIFQPILSLQRQKQVINAPDENDAQETKVIYVNEDDESNALPHTNPKSMGITVGGKTEGEKSKDRSHLALVKSFEPMANGYIFKLTPNVVFDPTRSQADNLYKAQPDYPEFKLRTKTRWIADQINSAMKRAEVDDYYIDKNNDQIQAWFKNPEDLAVAYASIMPNTAYQVDYLHCSPSASPMKMSKKIKKLKEIFAETGEKIKVRFIADKERRVIQAVTENTDDFIRVQGISRRLEKTDDRFQKLIGLK
ncbi:MAG: hypothetical protein DI626_03630 [Micavibrio aeruginosavorus]|uniref:Uncharacterized protein n=1 Tax=Micavibrio aeruginosavorus TaxID=349221 RepID=A0A2W5C0V1_9BACT|nr:MAG: hypothetical protein DI626_03630 [Micavibrio aeruginosavorus]